MLRTLLDKFGLDKSGQAPPARPLDFGQLRHTLHGADPINFYQLHRMLKRAQQANPEEFREVWMPYMLGFDLYWMPPCPGFVSEQCVDLVQMMPQLRVGLAAFRSMTPYLDAVNANARITYMDLTKVHAASAQQFHECLSRAKHLRWLGIAPGHLHLLTYHDFPHLEHLFIDYKDSSPHDKYSCTIIHDVMQKPWIGHLQSLSIFPLGGRRLLPNLDYSNAHQLTHLNLRKTRVDASYIKQIHEQLPQLKSLSLTRCKIDQSAFESIGQGYLPELAHLCFHDMHITQEHMHALCQRTSALTHLEMIDCELNTQTLKDIENSALGEGLCFLNLLKNYSHDPGHIYEGHIDLVCTTSTSGRWRRDQWHFPTHLIDEALDRLDDDEIRVLDVAHGPTHCTIESSGIEGARAHFCDLRKRQGLEDGQFKPLIITPKHDVAYHLRCVIEALLP